MHAKLPGDTLLALWEQGLAHAPAQRADAVLQALRGDAAPAPALGERHAQLADLHAQCFGAGIELLSHCPHCGTAAQFTSDCGTLAAAARREAPDDTVHSLTLGEHQLAFRLPTARDLALAASASGGAEGDDEQFARCLLAGCVLASRCGEVELAPAALPLAVLDALSQRMEALDPAASLSFSLACPQCAAQWEAPLDLGQLLWQKLQTAAERLLLDIDSLARCYGWTEAEVLALGPLRRAAYLQMATS